jgi:hypothetical protein
MFNFRSELVVFLMYQFICRHGTRIRRSCYFKNGSFLNTRDSRLRDFGRRVLKTVDVSLNVHLDTASFLFKILVDAIHASDNHARKLIKS